MTELTKKQMCQRTGLYPEALHRYRIRAYTVQLAKGTNDYQDRVDEFVIALARDLGVDRTEVKDQAIFLLSNPIIPVPESVS